jgi:hypothetical protein
MEVLQIGSQEGLLRIIINLVKIYQKITVFIWSWAWEFFLTSRRLMESLIH